MTDGGSAELHQKFKDAAERGGDWVTYPWRNSPGDDFPFKKKYSFILPAMSREGRLYVGVGFQSGSVLPQTRAPARPQPARSDEDSGDVWKPIVGVLAAVALLICVALCVVLMFWKRSRDKYEEMVTDRASVGVEPVSLGAAA